jgi:hypothetical protein
VATDTVLYESIDLVNELRVGPEVALAQTPGAYTCNPKVIIQGKFSNPLGNGGCSAWRVIVVGVWLQQ